MIWVSGLNNPTATGGFLFHCSTQDMSNFLRAHTVTAKKFPEITSSRSVICRTSCSDTLVDVGGSRAAVEKSSREGGRKGGREANTPRWPRTRTTRRTSLAQWHDGGIGENERRSCDSCRNYFGVAHQRFGYENCWLTSCYSVGSSRGFIVFRR